MEQLVKTGLSIEGRARRTDGKEEKFILNISAPEFDIEEEDYYCIVVCPIVLRRPSRIIGVDARQAFCLSLDFVSRLLAGRYIVLDSHGTEVNLLAFAR